MTRKRRTHDAASNLVCHWRAKQGWRGKKYKTAQQERQTYEQQIPPLTTMPSELTLTHASHLERDF